jgi:UDP-glucuronate 4-epimerase
MKKILITGSAGFIGFHLVSLLCKSSEYEILGLDNLNNYYDVNLKKGRLLENGINVNNLKEREIFFSNIYTNYKFIKLDITDHEFLVDLMIKEKFHYVINLAAQAGVRYSLENPRLYIKSNIDGFLSILEGCRLSNVEHLFYASTSSVYGLNTQMPLSEKQPTQHPISLYSATKKSNELMAHTYSHLFKLPTTGLRFFTVYGPWGRPDMALFLFTDAILNGKPINVFNHGNMVRDFTYVGDIVESIRRLLLKPVFAKSNWDSNNPDSDSSSAPYRIFNIGNGEPIKLTKYIEALEKVIGFDALKVMMDIQPGDVPITHSDTKSLQNYIDFKPQTSVEIGVDIFYKWYSKYYKIKNV